MKKIAVFVCLCTSLGAIGSFSKVQSTRAEGPEPARFQTGTIVGSVAIPALPPSRSARSLRYRRGTETQEVDTPESSEMSNVVIYLEGGVLEGSRSAGSRTPVLDQRDAEFIPHVLPIVKGTSVQIVNRDKTYHNVFSLSGAKKFNIGRRPTGEEVPVRFDKSGVVQVFCDIHSNMSAFIIVLDNPMFTQPSESGEFRITNVPAGVFTIQAWHERLSAPPQEVTVRAGANTTVNFTLQ